MMRTTKSLRSLTWFHVALGAAPVVLLALVDCGQPARWDDAEGVQQELAAGTYTFGTSTTTGKCIDVAGSSTANGAAVQQWTCNGGAAQSFRIENMGGASRVINVGSGKCLDVTQFGTANGTKVQQWSCSGSAAQAFRIEDLGSGRVRFVNTNSNKCLDVTGVGTTDGARLQIWSCAANSIAQTFRATKQGTTTTTGGSTTASTTTGSATTSGATGGGTWRRANLTNFTSYPDPGSDECVNFNGCMWAGQFAFVNGKQPESWVMANNILAVHSKDANTYKLKTLRLRQGTHQIDAKVYDMCADSDCSGCCTANSRETGFLIDIEKYTMQRFGSGGGIVEWMCLDCP